MFSREKSTENHPILKATSQNKVHLRSRQPRRANTSRNPIQTLPKNKTTLLIRIFFHNSRLHFKGKTPIEHFSYRSTIVSVRTRGTSRSSRSLNKTKKERLFTFVSFFHMLLTQTVLPEFIIGFSVAHWPTIRSRNPKVWGLILCGNLHGFLCLTSWEKTKKHLSLFDYQAQNSFALSFHPPQGWS